MNEDGPTDYGMFMLYTPVHVYWGEPERVSLWEQNVQT